MARKPTDYNRLTRTAKWWYAPENVTSKAKKTSRNFLVLLGIFLVSGLVLTFFLPSRNQQDTAGQAAALPVPPPVLVTSGCAPAEPVEYLPEQVVNATFESLWVLDGTMVRPTSTTGGPFSGDPYPRCFARTPEGALYAAASFATGALTATDNYDLKTFFDVRASHSGNYNAMISRLSTVPPSVDRPQTAITGFRWNNYTPQQVSLEIQFTATTGTSAGQKTATVYTLTWENNDWLLVVPGAADVVQAPADSTYIPWGETG